MATFLLGSTAAAATLGGLYGQDLTRSTATGSIILAGAGPAGGAGADTRRSDTDCETDRSAPPPMEAAADNADDAPAPTVDGRADANDRAPSSERAAEEDGPPPDNAVVSEPDTAPVQEPVQDDGIRTHLPDGQDTAPPSGPGVRPESGDESDMRERACEGGRFPAERTGDTAPPGDRGEPVDNGTDYAGEPEIPADNDTGAPGEPERPELPAGEDTGASEDRGETPDGDETPERPDVPTTELPTDGPGSTGDVIAGRVTTLDIGAGSARSVEILTKPAYGNVTVNPDNTLAVVLTGTDETDDLSFTVRVTDQDGKVTDRAIDLDVAAGSQKAGWGLGEFYMLATDENDDVIIETHDNHRAIHVSGSDDALSLNDIAALENLNFSDRGQWWGFFRDNPDYGSTPDMALDEEAADIAWRAINDSKFLPGPKSHWLMFERGYSYETFVPHASGASELTPAYIGAYGDGDRPVIEEKIGINGGARNTVFEGIEFAGGIHILGGENILFDDIVVTGEAETNFLNIDGLTIRNSYIYDVFREKSTLGGDTWGQHPDRISGLYAAKSEGILLENNFVDHNGWEDGYDYDLSTSFGQPVSKYSHNIYLQTTNFDITLRDNIIMRGASSGVQLRSGGFVEDNILLDNNGAILLARGGEDGGGNYSLFTNNVVTSAGHRDASHSIGELSYGVSNQNMMASLVDNIVTHLADPDNPGEFAEKVTGQHAVKHIFEQPFYDNTKIYNWEASGTAPMNDSADDRNVEGLDTAVLDETTIQEFTAQLLGRESATIADLADHLRAQADGALDDVVDADLIIAFFQDGFGMDTTLRGGAETLRFVPNPLGDGVRWDNRLNWDSGDLPGTQDGDSVDLAGNWVLYGGGTARIADLDFGDGGLLDVSQGRLDVEQVLSVGDKGAELTVDRAGQFWTDGYSDSDLLEIDAEGGRFANTGAFTGRAQLDVSDNAQVLLAAEGGRYVIGNGSGLSITGGDAKVGFDGDTGDTGTLLMTRNATLDFRAEDNELGRIGEFHSGHYDGDAPDIRSGIDLGDSLLRIDISDLTGGHGRYDLIDVDALIGTFSDVEITGLDAAQNAVLTVDYATDTVALHLEAPGQGSGAFRVDVYGDETDAAADGDLYAILTADHGHYSEAQPPAPGDDEQDPFIDF